MRAGPAEGSVSPGPSDSTTDHSYGKIKVLQ